MKKARFTETQIIAILAGLRHDGGEGEQRAHVPPQIRPMARCIAPMKFAQ